VVGSCGALVLDSRPGHIVRRHLLTILKEAEWTSARTKSGKTQGGSEGNGENLEKS
jgi:hypothetical protein